MWTVPLHPGLPDGRFATIRELCGRDEQAADEGVDALLMRLVVPVNGTSVAAWTLDQLALSDRDRLLAAVHRHHFGEAVEARLDCSSCGKAMELGFELADMEASLAAETTADRQADGSYRLSEGVRFRLPTLRDVWSEVPAEPAAAARALLVRCLLEGDPDRDGPSVERAMEGLAPLLDRELEATCPECGTAQRCRFEIGAYLAACLARERRWLHHEVHRMAKAYGWSLDEILSLPRSDRRAYVRLIAGESSGGSEWP